jgi:hypothetical protein
MTVGSGRMGKDEERKRGKKMPRKNIHLYFVL